MDGEDLAGSGEALSPDSLGLGDAASVDEGLVRMLKPEGKHSPEEMHFYLRGGIYVHAPVSI